MPYQGERDTVGRVWHPAPYQTGPATTGQVLGVWLFADEEIDWIWDHTGGNSQITGYTLKKKELPKGLPDEHKAV